MYLVYLCMDFSLYCHSSRGKKRGGETTTKDGCAAESVGKSRRIEIEMPFSSPPFLFPEKSNVCPQSPSPPSRSPFLLPTSQLKPPTPKKRSHHPLSLFLRQVEPVIFPSFTPRTKLLKSACHDRKKEREKK